ncbi:unnamed protein product, partial [Allacma fusca]
MATLAKLQKSQASVKSTLHTIEKDLNATTGKVTQVRYERLVKILDRQEVSMNETHTEIYRHLANAAEETVQDTEFGLLYNLHLSLVDRLDQLKPDSTPVMTRAKVKLPELEVPHFDGDIATWNSFHDLFVATVHN